MPMTGSPAEGDGEGHVVRALLTRSASSTSRGGVQLTSMPTLRSWLLRYSATSFAVRAGRAEVEGQREAHASCRACSRLVEQGAGLAEIERIGFHRLFIEGAGRDQGAGGRRGQAAVELVDDERAVDGVVDGLPDAHVGEFRLAEVEFEPVVRADALIALLVTARWASRSSRAMLRVFSTSGKSCASPWTWPSCSRRGP